MHLVVPAHRLTAAAAGYIRGAVSADDATLQLRGVWFQLSFFPGSLLLSAADVRLSPTTLD